MHWSDHPETVDALAAQYVLGTLQGSARRRFEALTDERAALREAVTRWEQQLGRLGSALPPVAPSPGLWNALAARAAVDAQADVTAGAAAVALSAATPLPAQAPAAPAAGPSAAAASPPSGPVSPGPAAPRRGPSPGLLQRLARVFDALLAPVPAAALALGLVAGLALPTVMTALSPPAAQDTELPESYVGVLATPDGRQGLIVASRRHGLVVDLKQVTPVTPPAGRTLFLWTIDAQGGVQPVGPVPHGAYVQAPLPAPAEQVFNTAVELAVSIEPIGTRPQAPDGDFVYRGLCGKVWRVPGAR